MKKGKHLSGRILAGSLTLSMIAGMVMPADIPVLAAESKAETVVNGNFETGDFTGWTLLDGTAITADSNDVGIINSGSTYWSGRNFYKEGSFFLSGAEKEGAAGTIRSTSFTLGGDGYIAFLIGAASTEGRGCVRVYKEVEDGEDQLIRTYTNKNWADPATGNTLLRIYDRLADYIGENLYFVIENGAEPGFSFINADDFRTSMTEEEVKALYTADAGRIKGVGDEYADTIRGLYKDVKFYDTDKLVGEGMPVRKSTLIKSLKSADTIAPGSTINLVNMIRKATAVADGFGTAVDYTITIDAIMHGDEDVREQAESLTLADGTYEVSYHISFLSDGKETAVEKTYTITVEKAEITEKVINGDFETGDLTGWTLMDGTPASSNDVGVVSDENYYWGNRNIYKQGDYCLRGDSKEGLSGQIRSSSFILGGDGYISFMIGAAAKENSGCIRVYEENGDEDVLIRTYTNKNWNDPKTGLTLIRVFDKLDSSLIGKELYFVVENGAEAGFSFINADDFRTSMTETEAKALQEEQLTWLEGKDDPYSEYIISCYRKNGLFNDIILSEEIAECINRYAGITVNIADLIANETKVVESYSLNEVDLSVAVNAVTFNGEAVTDDFTAITLQEGTYEVAYTRSYGDVTEEKTLTILVTALDASVVTVENPGFETGDLTGWEVLTPEIWNKDAEGKYAGVISAETYWGEQLPYNQEGNYHLDGWNVTGDERASWGLRSTPFTLGGSGFISVKMGAAAASVRVYQLDGTLIGTYYQNRFHDANFPFVNRGGSWADMGTYFIDLSDHLGEALYIELHDAKINGGWANAFFDDVQTYYEEKPDVENGFDTVTGPVSEGLEYGEIQIPWTLLTYAEDKAALSFEDENFDVVNAGGQQETAQLESLFRDPVFQDEPVLPYRPDGVVGKALNFDGYSNVASFNEAVAGSELTVDGYICPRAFKWANPGSDREDQVAEVIAASYDTGAKAGFLLGITKHGYLAFRVGTGDNWYSMTSNDGCQVELYEWSRVTGVFDGDEGVMRLYLNGELAGTKRIAKNSEIVNSGRPLIIGKGSETVIVSDNYFDGTMFPGLMDEITVSTRALSASEVKSAGHVLPEISYDAAKSPESLLANDYYRPTYHAVPPASWMNEPHALFQYKGKWHLFYQTNQAGPYWFNISWGHWVSDDMVNWKCVKDAVVPTAGTVAPDGIWTGNVIYTSDGEPLLLITAGDDSRTVNGSNQHVGLVRAADYNDPDLTDWEILGFCMAQTPEMGTVGEFRDAQCFAIGDERIMVVGGAKDGQGVAHVFKTTAATLNEWENAVKDGSLNGMNWTYMGNLFGDFYQNNEYKNAYGTVWEMPNLVPLQDEQGNPTDKYLFVFSPQYGDNDVWYYIGSFDEETCRFTPDYADAQLMDYGNNIFTGPTLYINPEDGRTYIASVMQENISGEYTRTVEDHINSGWAYYAGLPRELFLQADGKSLGIRNIDTASIEGETLASFENLTAEEANKLLAAVDSDTIKIEFIFTGQANEVGFNLKESENGATRFFVNKTSMGLDHTAGAYIMGDTVSGVIYVDKCSVEAYVDETKTVSGSKFFKGTGLSVFVDGDALVTATVKSMKSIHDNTVITDPDAPTDPDDPEEPDKPGKDKPKKDKTDKDKPNKDKSDKDKSDKDKPNKDKSNKDKTAKEKNNNKNKNSAEEPAEGQSMAAGLLEALKSFFK